MVNIRYSTGSNELSEIDFKIASQGSGQIEKISDKRAIFNKTDIPSDDFVGFKATTDNKGVFINLRNETEWDIRNGIFLILKEYENVYLTPYFNNSTGNAIKQYYSDGAWHKMDGPIQSNIIRIMPSPQSAKTIGLKFQAGAGKPSVNIHVTSVIVGGELVAFDELLSSSLIEEMNILSDDLPINEFDFSVACTQELKPGNKLSVYSDGEYFGTFWADSVDKVSQSYSGNENVYAIECINNIGMLDRCTFENCTFTFLNGPCSGEYSLVNEIKDKAGISVDIEREDANANYGILGLVPIQTLRFYLCAFAWSICKWVCTARRDDVYLRKISTKATKKISDDYIIGNATFKKNTPISYALWSHPMEDVDFRGTSTASSTTLPASSTIRKVYYDNPPSWIDINSPKFSFAEWTGNYFRYKATSQVSNIPIYTYPNKKKVEEIPGLSSSWSNEIDFNRFNCVGMKNYDVVSASQLNLLSSESPHDFYMGLLKKGTPISEQKYIDSENLIISQKRADIQKFIKSSGIVTANVILKDSLKDLQVGEMVRISTAFDGEITGIVTKMDISFGYYNTAKVEIRESSAFTR
ncbi:MAG: hypothetical protein PUA67_01810 [Ruminococcus sp.]|nr:hypothetical protein [Ruminococcus sp.]